MSAAEQIPRNSVIWLLSAQLAVILPHTPRMSWWMVAIWLLCAFWRMAMFRGEASYPGKIIRSILVVLGCVGVAISFGNLGALDIAVAGLILAFSLKLIEVRTRRDMYLVFYLALFIIAAAFLFSQSLILAIYQIGSILLVITAMVATQHSLYNRSPGLAMRVALKLIVQAVPVMVLFFLVFPRLGPIWSVPNSESSAGMGMSDSIEPGDIARLNQSSELVFRVEFDSDMPLRQDMYWRGLTLADFNGRKWSANRAAAGQFDTLATNMAGQTMPGQTSRDQAPAAIEIYGQPLRYRISLEATRQYWLFAMPVAQLVSAVGPPSLGVRTAPDFSLRSVKLLSRRSELSLESYLDYRADINLGEQARLVNTRLPADVNPRARQFAEQLYQRTGSTDAFVQQLIEHFVAEDFFYTLEPPALGEHSVDEFIFSTRSGYCEHYSNAFAFLLRAAGIPARVVVGYQGGELNPHNRTISVRQLDAHAWVEYWRAGAGWRRLDPTNSVAPERIDFGFAGALSRRPEFAGTDRFSPLYYRNNALIKSLRLRLDAVNYSWQRWVVGFGSDDQEQVLGNLLGGITPLKMALFVAVVLITLLATVALFVLRGAGKSRHRPEKILYLKFCNKVARALGLRRGVAETPLAFAERVATHNPACASEVQAITQQYIEIAYAGGERAAGYERMRAAIARFKPATRPRASV